jgi:alkanesulfonate monooxygenase SsuD/methylene tetrahydromethanopterin reductase-like flavin-dependent oxidoreductase (luciferase family)
LLAKMAVTADAVSDGGLVLGLGAGWYDDEYVAFGYPTDHRVGRLEEALQIVTALVSGDSVTFNGRYYRVREAALLPPPQRPIPILVAAKGPRMLRLVARHADAWNTAWFGRPDDRLRRRLSDLEEALAAEGRETTTLRRTAGIDVQGPDAAASGGPDDVPFRGSLSELAEALDEYAELGFDDVIVGLEPRSERSLDRLAEAVRMRAS